VSKKRGGGIQLREGNEPSSWQLPFRGGGYLSMQGPLFRPQEEAPCWYALQSILALPDRPTLRQLKYYDVNMVESASDGDDASSSDEECRRPRKRRRIAEQPARRLVHQQSFSYYQVISSGVNLFRNPSDPATIGLLSGVCLLYAHRRSHDRDEASTVYSIEAVMQTPLTGADHQVHVFFRPRGVCEWNGGRCSRHASEECANGCCSAAHCATRLFLCNKHREAHSL
jgi:hypothetical protein